MKIIEDLSFLFLKNWQVWNNTTEKKLKGILQVNFFAQYKLNLVKKYILKRWRIEFFFSKYWGRYFTGKWTFWASQQKTVFYQHRIIWCHKRELYASHCYSVISEGGRVRESRFNLSPNCVFLASFNTKFHASKERVLVNLQPQTHAYQFPAQKGFISFSGISFHCFTSVEVASTSWLFKGVTC